MPVMDDTSREYDKCCSDGVPMLISFLVGAAIGVGLVLFAEKKAAHEADRDYGDADLFV